MVVRKATTIVALVIAALIALRPMFVSASPPPRITAELSAPRGTTADIFVWSIIAHDTSEVPPPTIERSEDFEVRYRGPQSSVQIVNGVVSRELRYVYNLVPLREGTLHTPKATVVAAGREFEVAPLDVEIEKALQGSAHHSHNGVTVEQTFDRTTVYVGQQLTNTIEILTSIQLIEPQFGDLTFDGFRQLDIGDDQRTTRFVRGRPTTVITLKKALYPIRTGELTIPGRELRAKIRSQATHRGGFPFDLSDPFGGGLLDDFFGGGSLKEIRVSSAPTTITVKPLPSSTAPIITWGAHPALVGHTGINVRLDEGPLPFGESRSFTVELTSEGNIAPITALPFLESTSYRIYQEPPETKVFDSDGTIVTRKNFKATLVPLKGGVLKVPPFKITYFDPNQGEYKTTSSREFSVEVSGGPAKDTTAPSAGAAPTSAPIVSAEPIYEPLSVLARLGKHISLSLALLILSCILGTIGLFYLRHLRRQRALPRELAWRAIERARTAEELRSGFQQALTTELGLSPEATVPRLRTAVKERGFSADLEFTIESIFDTLDSMIYGRGEASDDLDGLRHRARAVRDALPRVS